MENYRVEEDTLGPVNIPIDALWGAQTERSRHNFPTGAKMPLELIRALLQIKKKQRLKRTRKLLQLLAKKLI